MILIADTKILHRYLMYSRNVNEEIDFTVLEKTSERVKIHNHITNKKEWLFLEYFNGHPNSRPYNVDYQYRIEEELPKIKSYNLLNLIFKKFIV